METQNNQIDHLNGSGLSPQPTSGKNKNLLVLISSIILILLFTFLYFHFRQTSLYWAESSFKKGESSYTNGDVDTAILDFTQAIQYNPDYAQAYFQRGLAYIKQINNQNATADFEKTLELCGSNATLCQQAQQQLDLLK